MDEQRLLEYAEYLGLTKNEFNYIVSRLNRFPNKTEIAIFSGMWSEHCSYKSTKHYLKKFNLKNENIVAGPGSHAGVIRVDGDWCVAFKIESHNHPSEVDPFQGAATGVGGILRDIVAQGARPVAIMDGLCFGDPNLQKTRYLQKGVVSGISFYGNAYGVANIGGKTVYNKKYNGNTLVNALAIGILKEGDIKTAKAEGIGNLLLYVGAKTGKDGIFGASFASEELSGDDNRPQVQVGDPFMGRKLMESTIAFFNKFKDKVISCQDMGACGITCSVFEMAAVGMLE